LLLELCHMMVAAEGPAQQLPEVVIVARRGEQVVHQAISQLGEEPALDWNARAAEEDAGVGAAQDPAECVNERAPDRRGCVEEPDQLPGAVYIGAMTRPLHQRDKGVGPRAVILGACEGKDRVGQRRGCLR
jgi:hypothetical protein